jgi:hypothetical protein
MHSDFSTKGRHMRDSIEAPAVPLESIRDRSRTAGAHSRLRTFAAAIVIALSAVGAATVVGAKIYNGVHFWFSGGRVAAEIHSGVLLRQPIAADLRNAIARATFPVVFPAGIPAGTRVNLVTAAPIDRPSAITIGYQNPNGFKSSFALLDPAVVTPDAASIPKIGARLGMGSYYNWRQGGEIVVVGSKISPAVLDRIKAATAKVSAADSLAATEAMLPKITVIGTTVRLEIAERYAPPNGRSVLVSDEYFGSVAAFAKAAKPLLDNRIIRMTNLAPGDARLMKATIEPPTEIAVPAGGVRAIEAVLQTPENRYDRNCEILFNQPNSGTYWVWKIPLAPSGPVKKYAVDAKTFAIAPV